MTNSHFTHVRLCLPGGKYNWHLVARAKTLARRQRYVVGTPVLVDHIHTSATPTLPAVGDTWDVLVHARHRLVQQHQHQRREENVASCHRFVSSD